MRKPSLVLGGAQLGQQYGVANRNGMPSMEMAQEIVRTAYDHGVRMFDTAQAYGDSERILGEVFSGFSPEEKKCLQVITKISLNKGQSISDLIQSSLSRLQLSSLEAVLLHREEDFLLLGKSEIQEIEHLKSAGLIRQFGVSHYRPEFFSQICGSEETDCFQVPANVWDHRFLAPAINLPARKSVYLRSVFLQGLALMPVPEVPCWIPGAAEAVAALDTFCTAHRLDRMPFCLGFLASSVPLDNLHFVIGAEHPQQIREFCKALDEMPAEAALYQQWRVEHPLWSEDLLNPSRWKKTAQ